MSVNLAEAKAKLSSFVDRAAAGEEIVIAKAGKPVARLVPLADRPRRPIGIASHWLATGFDLGDMAIYAPQPEDAETPALDIEWQDRD